MRGEGGLYTLISRNILENVEVESYLEDVSKLQEELNDAENKLNRGRDREKGVAVANA